jgi:hypothetical protein
VEKSEFLVDVIHEIKALKANATVEELAALDLNYLNPKSSNLCIYGQMTGYCASQRAKELMDVSCIRVWDFTTSEPISSRRSQPYTFDEIKDSINGSYSRQTWEELILTSTDSDWYRDYNYISALEGYICLTDAKLKPIIDYLKGEIESLEISDLL